MKQDHTTVFSDPLYGYIQIENPIILELINTAYFQRLRRIKQLSGVAMVFHCGEHSRFSHSLGVYELARRYSTLKPIEASLDERSQTLLLVASLLHDIGHGPYSHDFEVVFGSNHEKIGAKIIADDKEINLILNKLDKSFASDVQNIILKKGKYPLIEEIISSQIDIDRLDYLRRDSYFTGTSYGLVDLDKIMRSIAVKDNHLVYKETGLNAIEDFLISRHHMYSQIYYHVSGRSYEFILGKIYQRIYDLIKVGYNFNEDINLLKRVMDNSMDIEAYLTIDDFYINGLINSFTRGSDEILKRLSIDFLNRKIWGYIDDSEENQPLINQIKKEFEKDESHYYSGLRDVRKTEQKSSVYDDRKEIMILTKKDEVKPLSVVSKIIKNLEDVYAISEPKFFYRKKWKKNYI